jgi:hypothetical protein
MLTSVAKKCSARTPARLSAGGAGAGGRTARAVGIAVQRSAPWIFGVPERGGAPTRGGEAARVHLVHVMRRAVRGAEARARVRFRAKRRAPRAALRVLATRMDEVNVPRLPMPQAARRVALRGTLLTKNRGAHAGDTPAAPAARPVSVRDGARGVATQLLQVEGGGGERGGERDRPRMRMSFPG